MYTNSIKRGDSGSEVRLWQEFLKNLGYYSGELDGVFGHQTHISTKSFQSNTGLISDGIVGPNTWKTSYEMGIITTDGLEVSHTIESDVNIQKAYMPRSEYYIHNGKKEWIFLHHTAGWDNPYSTIKNWSNDNRGRVATEFCIGGQKISDGSNKFDGCIVQAFPDSGYGWHLGIGNNLMHRASVGIEVNNFGYLTEGGYHKTINGKNIWIEGDSGKFYNYVGVSAHPDQIIKLDKPFRGYEYWHRYSDKQLIELRKLIQYIGYRNNIDVRKGLPDLIRKKGSKAFDICDVEMCKKIPGLWNHTNVKTTKFDMFPQPELIDMLLSL